MAKLTMAIGAILIALSLGFWLAMNRAETAALHPGGLGVLILLCGVLANSDNARKRMLWMHIAVTLGLIGFLITGIRAALNMAHGLASGLPFEERVLTAIICLVFVALCVRSFIGARRNRLA